MLLFFLCVCAIASPGGCVRALEPDECVKMVNVVQIVLRESSSPSCRIRHRSYGRIGVSKEKCPSKTEINIRKLLEVFFLLLRSDIYCSVARVCSQIIFSTWL